MERTHDQVKPGFNRSWTYMMPILGDLRSDFKNLKSCFIGDEEKPHLNDHIFLLHEFSGERSFTRYEEGLEGHHLFVERYDPDKLHVMYVFSTPENMMENRRHFLDSRYSRMSERYKMHIMNFFGLNPDNIVAKVLWRHESLYEELEKSLSVDMPGSAGRLRIPRDQEVTEKIDMNVEMYSSWMKQEEVIVPNPDFKIDRSV